MTKVRAQRRCTESDKNRLTEMFRRNVLTPEWRDNQRRRAIFNTFARIHIHPFSAALAGLFPGHHRPYPPAFPPLFRAFHSFYCANVQAAVFSPFCPVFCLPY